MAEYFGLFVKYIPLLLLGLKNTIIIAIGGVALGTLLGIVLCLTTMGGLYSDKEARVYDNDKHVIPGLYAAGNIQGNRFALKYPFKLSGASHAMAMFYGHVAGENVAGK